jgi:hypothetical protein
MATRLDTLLVVIVSASIIPTGCRPGDREPRRYIANQPEVEPGDESSHLSKENHIHRTQKNKERTNLFRKVVTQLYSQLHRHGNCLELQSKQLLSSFTANSTPMTTFLTH